MKGLKMALLAVMLCLVVSWGVSTGFAQDNQGDKEKPDKRQGWGEKKDQPKGQQEFNKRMPPKGQQGFGGLVDFMKNAKVEAEMKRHMDVMKAYLEEAKDLKKQIIESVKDKMDELKEQRDSAKDDSSVDSETVKPKGDKKERVKEEIKKVVETYRPQADVIAGKITAELEQHHQNLATIIKSEEASIKGKITDQILSPMRPGKGMEKGHEKGPRGKGEEGRQGRHGPDGGREMPENHEGSEFPE